MSTQNGVAVSYEDGAGQSVPEGDLAVDREADLATTGAAGLQAAPAGTGQQSAGTVSAANPPAEPEGLVSLTNVAIAIAVLAVLALVVVVLRNRRKPAPSRSGSRSQAAHESGSGHALGRAGGDPNQIVGEMKRDLNALQNKVDMLERKVERLAGAAHASGSGAAPAMPAVADWSYDPPAAAPLPSFERQDDPYASYGAADPAPAPAMAPPEPSLPLQPALHEETDGLTRRYAELLGSGMKSRSRFDEFFLDMEKPHGFVAAADGTSLRVDDDAEPLLAGGLVRDHYVVFPAFDFVSNFATLYNAERAMPPELRAAFDFTVDDTRNLIVEKPAVLAPSGGRFIVVEKGSMSGLLS